MFILFYSICLLFLIQNVYSKQFKPNIIFILTDDQDLLLDGMKPMQNAINMIGNNGVTFENAFVNSPLCCPSRSSLLTGRYAHNTRVWNNSISGGCASLEWRNNSEPYTVAAILQKNAQYHTFYAGKYLNQYGKGTSEDKYEVPVGWNSWFGLIGNSKYYNYSLSENGKVVRYKNAYLTDVIKTKAVQFLKDNLMLERPIFMMLAPPAPHAPATPAPRHKNQFPKASAPRTPAFNYSSVDKHWLITQPPAPLPNPDRIDDLQQHRLRSLLAVDELVAAVFEELSNQLNNTYFFYTSDNGYHLGQFCLPWDKRQPYDTDVRVPLMVRGPSLPSRFVSQTVVQIVDLAPTFLELAGLKTPSSMDGQSFLQNLLNEQIQQQIQQTDVLLEYSGEGDAHTNDKTCPNAFDNNLAECGQESWCKCQDARNNTYSCVRRLSPTTNFLYCRFTDLKDFVEAYDLKVDKYQLKNIYSSMKADDIQEYESVLNKLRECKGYEECR